MHRGRDPTSPPCRPAVTADRSRRHLREPPHHTNRRAPGGCPGARRGRPPGHDRRAGPAERDAGIRPAPEDECRASGRRDARNAQRQLDGRQDIRVRAGRQTLPVRRRDEDGHGHRRRAGARRTWRSRPGRRTGPWPSGRIRRLSRREAQGCLPRPQSVPRGRVRRERRADHDRRQRGGSHQIRNGQLGLRRRVEPDDGHVVVARQHEAGLLPVRREAGARLFPSARPDEDPEHRGHGGVPESRRPQPGGRPVRLRRGDEEVHAHRRARRQAVRRLRGGPLRVSHPVVA